MRITPTITALIVGVAIGYAIATPGRGRTTADLMREMHNAGYRKGIAHAALGLLDPQPPAGGARYARGNDTSDRTRTAE